MQFPVPIELIPDVNEHHFLLLTYALQAYVYPHSSAESEEIGIVPWDQSAHHTPSATFPKLTDQGLVYTRIITQAWQGNQFSWSRCRLPGIYAKFTSLNTLFILHVLGVLILP